MRDTGSMDHDDQLQPGSPAPASGRYELLNVFGSPSGMQVMLQAGEALPPAPYAWAWGLLPSVPA